MAIYYPIATDVRQALAGPIGHATRAGAARALAARWLLDDGEREPGVEADAEFASAITCEDADGWAPGYWRSREACAARWKAPIDAHWAEPLALTGRRWRLNVRYIRVAAPGRAATRDSRTAIKQRLAAPIQPKRPAPQLAPDFGLFAARVAAAMPTSPDALTTGSYEVADPLRPGSVLTDE